MCADADLFHGRLRTWRLGAAASAPVRRLCVSRFSGTAATAHASYVDESCAAPDRAPTQQAAHVRNNCRTPRSRAHTCTLLAFAKLPASGRAQLRSLTAASTSQRATKYKVSAAQSAAAVWACTLSRSLSCFCEDFTTSVSTARHRATVSDVARSPAARTKAARTRQCSRHHSQNTHYSACLCAQRPLRPRVFYAS